MPTPLWQYAVVGVLSILALGAGVYVLRKRASDDTADEETGAHRQQQIDNLRDRGKLTTRERLSRLTWPVKVIMAGGLVIAVVVVGSVYSYLRSGSPLQILTATHTIHAGFVFLGVLVGMVYLRRRNSLDGVAYVEYEKQDAAGEVDRSQETIYYSTADTEETEQGTVIYEYKASRLFGLFRQPVVHADRPELRDDEGVSRPPTEKVAHQVPESATEFDDGTITWSTSGRDISRAPTTKADFVYQPGYTTSLEERLRVRADHDTMRKKLRHAEARRAERDKQIRELEDRIEELLEDPKKEVYEELERIRDLVNPRRTERVVQRQADEPAHSSRGGEGGDPRTNGSTNGAGTATDGGYDS